MVRNDFFYLHIYTGTLNGLHRNKTMSCVEKIHPKRTLHAQQIHVTDILYEMYMTQ